MSEYGYGLTSFCLDDRGNEAPDACKVLYIGQKLTAGSAVANVAVKVRSRAEAISFFGIGSVLEYASRGHFRNDLQGKTDLWVIPLDDAATGVKATYTQTITGTATEAGSQYFRFQQKLYNVGVVATMTAAQFATVVASAINGDNEALFTATDDGAGEITFTAKNAGAVGNNLKIQYNPLTGNKTPAGLVIGALTVDTAGANDPLFATTLALSIAGCKYDCIADLTLNNGNREALGVYLDSITGTWKCGRNLKFGHSFHAAQDTVGSMSAFYEATNRQEWTAIPVPKNYHIPAFMFPATWATRNCMSVCTNVSRPVQLQNGFLHGLEDFSACGGVWTEEEKDMMAKAGMAVWDVSNNSGEYRSTLWILGNFTNYKRGVGGKADQTWKTTESRYQWAAFSRLLDAKYFADYNSVGIANNGTRLQAGKDAVTPLMIKADLDTWLATTAFGIVEDSGRGDYFTVTRDTDGKECGVGDENRVNIFVKPNRINQLLHIATTIKASVENC